LTNVSVHVGDRLDFNKVFRFDECVYVVCNTNGSLSLIDNLYPCENCSFIEWSSWSACPSCSNFKVYQNRTRQNNINSNCNDTFESQECKIPTCSCINGYDCPCVISEWSSWTSCSKSCGLGTRSRERTYISTGLNCSNENLLEQGDCNPECCPGYILFINFCLYLWVSYFLK